MKILMAIIIKMNSKQNPNLTFDNQSTAHILYSNTNLVPKRLVTELDLQQLIQDPAILPKNYTIITNTINNIQKL